MILLGDSAVGKTSMVRRYVEDRYDDRYKSTVGAKVSKKPLHFYIDQDPVEMKLMLWDIIGSRGYQSTQARYMAGADCALLVYDLGRPETFGSLVNYWFPLLCKTTHGLIPVIMLAGNKSDLLAKEDRPEEREVLDRFLSSDDVSEATGDMPPGSIHWRPTSAKTGENVDQLFYEMGLITYRAHWKTTDVSGWVLDGLEELGAEDVMWGTERDTLLSLADLIMAELPGLGPTETAEEIIDECFNLGDFDKDDPTPAGLQEVIGTATRRAREEDFDRAKLEAKRRKWLEILSEIGSKT